MTNYYIDPAGTGDGSSDLNPASSLPGTLVNGTNYLFKAGTTYNRGASAIALTNKSGIAFDTWYGTGKASIITNSGTIVFSTGGTTANLSIKNLTLENSNNSAIYINSPITSLEIDGVDIIDPINVGTYGRISFAANTNLSNISIKNLTIDGGYRGISMLCSTPSLTLSDILIENITFKNLRDYIIRLTTESANDAWLSSVINNVTIRGVTADRNYGAIWLRSSYTPTVAADYWSPPVRGNSVLVENCKITNSAENLDNTLMGGLSFTGINNSTIRNNTLINTTTKGAQIGSTLTTNTIFENNYCEHGVAVLNSDGKYIDALGIFCDQGNQNCTVRNNTIVDCPGYNIVGNPALMEPNSGGGIGLWNCGNNKVYGNVIKDSKYGFSYGHVLETGNQVFNNIDIGCQASFKKYGNSALTGNTTSSNNISIGASTLLETGSNPSMADAGGNQLFTTASDAGVLLNSVGIPYNLSPNSTCIDSGIDLTIYCEDRYSRPFYSPPNMGAFSSIKGVFNFGLFN